MIRLVERRRVDDVVGGGPRHRWWWWPWSYFQDSEPPPHSSRKLRHLSRQNPCSSGRARTPTINGRRHPVTSFWGGWTGTCDDAAKAVEYEKDSDDCCGEGNGPAVSSVGAGKDGNRRVHASRGVSQLKAIEFSEFFPLYIDEFLRGCRIIPAKTTPG